MKTNSNKMEKENILMEQKISALKEKLRKEKEERERMGGPRWQSSQLENKGSAKQRAPRRIKVLSDEPVENYRNKNKLATDGSKHFRLCGQCEHKKAKVLCQECNENYCSFCYKQFHSKGALRKHTWKSLQDQETKQENAVNSSSVSPKTSSADNSRSTEVISVTGFSVNQKSPTATKNPPSSSVKVHSKSLGESFQMAALDERKWVGSIPVGSYQKDYHCIGNSAADGYHDYNSVLPYVHSEAGSVSSLLDGTYDEKKNAESFKQALQEWRQTGDDMIKRNKTKPVIKTHSASVGSDNPVNVANTSLVKVNIKLNSSMTYMDRLMLKKNRKDPEAFMGQISSSRNREPLEMEDNYDTPPRETKTPSSCILSVKCTPTLSDLSSSIEIDIFPVGNEELLDDSVDICNTAPIISQGDCDELPNHVVSFTPSKTHSVGIVEVNFLNEPNNSPPPIAASSRNPIQPNIYQSPSQSIRTDIIESPRWKPRPSYQSMEEYFAIGVNSDEKMKSIGVNHVGNEEDMTNNTQPILIGGDIWEPHQSFIVEEKEEERNKEVKLLSQVKQLNSPRTSIDFYDFLGALPSQSKEDSLFHMHRASSALSISGLPPYDLWQDSDCSVPNSRRPSQNVTMKFEQINEQFEKIRKEARLTQISKDVSSDFYSDNTKE